LGRIGSQWCYSAINDQLEFVVLDNLGDSFLAEC
jgi:hypothetical protein